MKLPLGRVLIGTGFLTDDVLNAALSAQSLIRDNLLPQDVAVKALKEVQKKGITFAEALREFGINADHLEFTNKLGQLLVDSEMITVNQRNESLQVALAAGLPIGRVLVFKRAISNMHAYGALSAQVLIRAKKIAREQAVEALKMSKKSNCTFEAALRNGGYVNTNASNRIMLGELFIISNQISEVEFLTALENSLSDDRPLGKVLIDLQLISQDQLDRALAAQSQVCNGELSAADAAELLQQIDIESMPLETPATASAIASSEPAFGILELLVFGKLITNHQANYARLESVSSGLSLPQVLVQRELVGSITLEGVSRCLAFYENSINTAEESILAFYTWYARPDQPVDDVICRIAQRDLV